MQKTLIVVCFFVFLLIVWSSITNAQTDTSISNAARLKQQLQELQAQKQTTVHQVKKEARIDLRQQMKDAVQAKRLKLNAIVKAKREEFKAKLQTIRDEKKKALVERIDTKLTNINVKHTDRFTQVLSNLQTLLDKISLTATEASVLADIATAQAAIDSAKLAVENQAARTYTITISTENDLRLDVGIVTNQLRQELVTTHKLVVDAKQAVQALRKDNAMIKNEATNSANL